MLCALAAARPDLRRHALWIALAALPFFLAAPLICALAALGGREAALAVETSSALAGAAALCALFFSERAHGAASGAHGAPLWALWGVRAAWLVVALWVSAWITALLLEATGCSFAPRAAWALPTPLFWAALPLWPPPLPAALFSRRRCAPCGSPSTSAASCHPP